MREATPVEFLVVGECVVDVVRSASAPDRPHPGGSPANVAYGLARLGRRTALLTQLGPDPGGALMRRHLESAGVELYTDGTTGPTPRAVVSLDQHGHASYEFAIGWSLRPTPVPPARQVHVGSIAAVMAPGAATVHTLLREQRAAGARISFDPNVRPALFGDRAAGLAAVEACVALSHLVKASDEDLGWLYPELTAAEAAARWRTLGPHTVVVTRGAQGAFALTAEGGCAVDAVPAEVVDTVGAGDAFMSALLSARFEHPLPDALRTAATAAALTVARAGANPPTSAELAAADT
ncbi:carbohydrate kinase [Streptomyces tateyamensis]|uniref:Carbohydrate kinase n=1 Tax=Streptomyces tateyamensis TaxID=565073 RepID=A0A2V4NMV2_9ACTN|nr:carbohydrate kinase [Streptomyces tateyamensis]PYC87902.1 carbohydrate kinase [Streptomyces tateyamensis]